MQDSNTVAFALAIIWVEIATGRDENRLAHGIVIVCVPTSARNISKFPDDADEKIFVQAAELELFISACFPISWASNMTTGESADRRVKPMIDDIYNEHLLALAAGIPRLGRLESPDGTGKAHSRLCGSKVTVDVAVKDGKISDFRQDVKACALGQASSSIMGAHAIGSSIEDLRAVRDGMYKMLKEGAAAPTDLGDGRWSELQYLEPVRDFKARHASTLLTFDATVAAMEQALETKGEAA